MSSRDVDPALDDAYESLNDLLDERKDIDGELRDELKQTLDTFEYIRDENRQLEAQSEEYRRKLLRLTDDFEMYVRGDIQDRERIKNDVRQTRRELEQLSNVDVKKRSSLNKVAVGLATLFGLGATDYANILPEDKNCGAGWRLTDEPSGDFDLFGRSAEQGGCESKPISKDSKKDDGLKNVLENSEYDFWIAEDFDDDDRPIGDIIDEYKGYDGQIGSLEGQLEEEYAESYQDLVLGFHDDTNYVQLKDNSDSLLVNFDFDEKAQYQEAKETAEWVIE